MLINEAKSVEMDAMKEVKIRIPVRSYVKLRSMKVLTGKQISDAVNEALEDYFTRARSSAGKDAKLEAAIKTPRA